MGIISFKKLDEFTTSKGRVVIVENDIERDRSNTGLVGKKILINNTQCEVKAVESFAVCRDIVKGESIGLLID